MEQFYILLSMIIGFGIVTYAIPRIIYVSNKKKLFDIPNERSAARTITPNLGGIGIFAGFYVSLLVTLDNFDIHPIICLLLASVSMFLLGLKDDLVSLSPRKKLFFQLLTAMYLIFLGDVRITNFHGILGVYEIDATLSALVSLVAIVGVINAYNLIDGIDGLAAGIGILASIAFGLFFILAGDIVHAVVGFSLTGCLIAFFFYNVFGRDNKIFMGDTGSLTLGIIFAFLMIRYIELPVDAHHLTGSPAIALAILIVPIVDTVRVMSIRMAHKRSPFSPDMNHIHHHLLRLTNGNHLHASLIMVVTNLAFVVFTCSFVKVIGEFGMFFLLIAAGFAIAYIPVYANKVHDGRLHAEEAGRIIQLKPETTVQENKTAEL